MDYFTVFLIIIIIFTFLSDKKVLSKEYIAETIEDIEIKIDNIYSKSLNL